MKTPTQSPRRASGEMPWIEFQPLPGAPALPFELKPLRDLDASFQTVRLAGTIPSEAQSRAGRYPD